jgi:hypothetical protein
VPRYADLIEKWAEMSKGELLAAIHRVFDNADIPRPENIVPEEYADDIEFSEVTAVLQGKSWKDLDKTLIQSNTDIVWRLTSAAFRYYLPAFLAYAIQEEAGSAVLPEEIFFLLTPTPERFAQSRWLQDRLSHFSSAQIDVIVAFCQYMLATFPDLSEKSIDELIEIWAGVRSGNIDGN